VIKVAINGADQPSMSDVLEQLLEVINHTFDFQKKVSIKMELMQSNVAQMAMYGIFIGIPQLTLTLLANIETVTKSNYSHEFRSAMHAIRKKCTYNHVHDATLLQTILTELAGADRVRALKDTLAPNAGMVHSVVGSVSFLHLMMNDETDKYTESAYGASSDSGSSEEWQQSLEQEHKKTKKIQTSREKEEGDGQGKG
jgi:hypothetical protein